MPPGPPLPITALSTPLSASSSLSPKRAGTPAQVLVYSGCLINNKDGKDQPSQGRKGSTALKFSGEERYFPQGQQKMGRHRAALSVIIGHLGLQETGLSSNPDSATSASS